MVEVIRTLSSDRHDRGFGTAAYGAPLIHIHDVERHVFGNATVVKVWGQMKIAAKEVVFARELKLNTLQVLLLTVETGYHWPWTANKWVYHKGEFDNYASIDILSPQTGYQWDADSRNDPVVVPSTLPADGSIWLNFMALGE